MKKKRKNPKLGKHRDLFEPEDTVVLVHWRDVPERIMETLSATDFSADELAEIEEEDEALFEQLTERDEEAQEARVAALANYYFAVGEDHIDYELNGDGSEYLFDEFQKALDAGEVDLDDVLEQLKSQDDEFKHVQVWQIEEILLDPSYYEGGSVDKVPEGLSEVYTIDTERDRDGWDVQLEGTRYDSPPEEDLEKLFEHDLPELVRVLERGNDKVTVYLSRWRKGELTLDDLHGAHNARIYSNGMDTNYVVWPRLSYMRTALDEAIADGLSKKPKFEGRGDDKVVFEFPDGAYVADLRANQLRREGAMQGICVGNESFSYTRDVQSGKTKIFSLRRATGKPLLTMEYNTRAGTIEQVKGKGNRLPGFGSRDTSTVDRPGEVEQAVKFVTEHLGLDPANIRDLAPGYRAISRAQEEPRANPRRRNPEERAIPVDARTQRLAERAYAEPFGGVWGQG